MLSHRNKDRQFLLLILKKLFEDKSKLRASLFSPSVSNTKENQKKKSVEWVRDGSSNFFLPLLRPTKTYFFTKHDGHMSE